MISGRRVLLGSRALCVSQGQVLLVEHRDPQTHLSYWVLPGGGREIGETFAEAAIREVREETGVTVRIVRRLRVPAHQEQVTYALFQVEPVKHTEAAPLVDLCAETYLRGAAWHPVTTENPLGPLHEDYWGYLGPRIRRLLRHR
jgi:8-oxo-dGTP pyrophosphatase MutT (NUDIX family)